MNYMELKNSEIRISEMILGCWALGGGYTWGDQEEAESIATVHAALDLGINTFDTAEFYGGGRSEEVLGKALHSGPATRVETPQARHDHKRRRRRPKRQIRGRAGFVAGKYCGAKRNPHIVCG